MSHARRLRVAVVAPSLGILGGQAVQADRLLRLWDDDPDVHAWLVPVNPQPPGPFRHATRVRYLRTVATELTYGPLLLRELRRADVVHVFSASYTSFLLAPLPAIAVARLLGKPVLLNYRSGEAPDHLARSSVARRTLAAVERNVVPSRFLADVFRSHGIDSVIIPNVVDLDRFAYRPRTPLRPRLLSTRNLEPLYNVACTLRAFALVQQCYPAATLTLVGAGSQLAVLRGLSESLGLTGVTFLGRVAPGDIARYYADHDIYLQTPNIDNMPTSILEAYASGLPVVSTDAGGIAVICRHGVDGLLAEVNDERQIAAHVLALLGDAALARSLAETAHGTCERYSWPALRPQWLEVYRALANGQPQPAPSKRWSLES